VLATVRQAYPALFVVGFAAETDDLETHARGKLQRKGLDLIAANWVGQGRAFDQDDNSLQLFWDGGQHAIGHASKVAVAAELADVIVARRAQKL